MTLITFIPIYGYKLTHNNVDVKIMMIMNLVYQKYVAYFVLFPRVISY